MATFRSTFTVVSERATTGSTIPALKGRGANGLDELETSATSQIVQDEDSTTSPVQSQDWEAPTVGFVTMRPTGAVWVQIGKNPVAAETKDWFIAADERIDLAVEAGDKIAVIDDS